MSVIVTNARNRIAYNIVKSLGSKEIPVYTADFVPRSMSFYSRYSLSDFIYPSPYRNQIEFIDSLIYNIRRLGAGVLIPVHEETFLISKFKSKLNPHIRMVIPDYDKILVAHNKDQWEQVAQSLGILVPRSYSIDAMRSGSITPREIQFPMLIKPKQGGGAWGIQQANSSEQLERLLEPDHYLGRPWSRFFLQEKIAGETHCVAMLFRLGEIRAKITYRQLRDYPVSGGQATLRVSLRNESAEEYLRILLKELRWHGVCQADFIVDRNSGKNYLIDLNPRFWGSLTQAVASGVDFPYLIYKIATQGDVEPVASFQTGVFTRWLGGDIMTFIPLLRKSKDRFGFIKEYLSPCDGKVLYDDFSLKDPLPFIAWTADTVLRSIKNCFRNSKKNDFLEGIWD